MREPSVNLEADPSTRRKSTRLDIFGYLCTGLLYYFLSSLIVVLGVVAGQQFFKSRRASGSDSLTLIRPFTRWDGQWYQRIVVQGYSYDPERWSSVAFCPVYPLVARTAVNLINVTPDFALLIVSHASLAGAFVLTAAYVRQRYRSAPPEMTRYVLLALGLAPFTYFFRMAYSEALFLFLTIVALYGIERKWSLLTIALIIGLATATRPVGLGLLAPLVVHIWRRSSTRIVFVARFLSIVPIACWGIAGFMLYQCGQFGDPLAFVKSHGTWRLRPPARWPDKLIALETLEPIWAVFDPSSPCYWKRSEPSNSLLFNQAIFNRVSFLLAISLAFLGKYKRWLSSYEVALVGSLLFIPYVGRGYDMCMASMARFTSVAFPIYLVMGNLLCRMPAPLSAGLLGISSLLLGIYAALFAASYPFF